MMGRWMLSLSLVCLYVWGCDGSEPKKPDPTKGVVTGIVIASDTGKPARFATVYLFQHQGSGVAGQIVDDTPDIEGATTGLDGRFRMEAVPPGDFYAFATQDGYLDPERFRDASRLAATATDKQIEADSFEQWKDHMVDISVGVHRTTEVSHTMDRGAEISGNVSFDDGSPAIGMRFMLLRKNSKGAWFDVGSNPGNGFALEEKSDGRGRYSISNLPSGEFKICTMLPGNSQQSSLRVCLGNTFRSKDAKSVTVGAGDVAGGTDIVIPLTGLHSVAGTLSTGAGNHPASKARLTLLYADNREQALSMPADSDGTFNFPWVPEGKYILSITDANYTEPAVAANAANNSPATSAKTHVLANREIPVLVEDDLADLAIPLAEVPQVAIPPR